MRVRLDLASPVLQDSRLFAKVARLAIESAILTNRVHLRRFPKTPPLYQAGVRYRLEPDGTEDFADIETVIDRGYGDCAHLSAWRVAELRENGEQATIRLEWVKNPRTGQRMFHVLVRRADGRIEDPSTLLGMRSGEARTPDRLPMIGYRRRDGR